MPTDQNRTKLMSIMAIVTIMIMGIIIYIAYTGVQADEIIPGKVTVTAVAEPGVTFKGEIVQLILCDYYTKPCESATLTADQPAKTFTIQRLSAPRLYYTSIAFVDQTIDVVGSGQQQFNVYNGDQINVTYRFKSNVPKVEPAPSPSISPAVNPATSPAASPVSEMTTPPVSAAPAVVATPSNSPSPVPAVVATPSNSAKPKAKLSKSSPVVSPSVKVSSPNPSVTIATTSSPIVSNVQINQVAPAKKESRLKAFFVRLIDILVFWR